MESVSSLFHQVAPVYTRKRAVPAGTVTRYNLALDFVRDSLKFGAEVEFSSTMFNEKFSVSTSFITALHTLNAVSRRRKQGKSYCYKALPKLETILPLEISNELAKGSKASKKSHPVDPEPAQIEPATSPAPVAEPAPAMKVNETYLIGAIDDDGKIRIDLSSKIDGNDINLFTRLERFPCMPGQRVILLKVEKVLKPTRVMEPTTL